MAYPPPPGLTTSRPSSGTSTPQPHPSLPARPPPLASSSLPPKPPASINGGAGGLSRPGAFTGFKPRTVASASATATATPTPGWQPPTQPSYSAGPAPPSNFPGAQPSYQQPQSYYPQQAQPQYYSQTQAYTETPPQIRNPFPAPGQASASRGAGGGGSYDPDIEAQIAQWQSAYLVKDDSKGAGRGQTQGSGPAGGANAIPLNNNRIGGAAGPGNNVDVSTAAPADTGVAAVVTGADGKQKTVVRSGGGTSWQDSSLLEWDPAHFRLFVGNLAGEVTDESLLKAFSRYTSLQKARVIRDKRSTKSKGYGFVSFSDGDDYFQAAKEMQGKYIGSHPVLIKRSTTDIKVSNPHDKKKNFKSKGNFDPTHSNTGAGINKKSAKTRNGMKILG